MKKILSLLCFLLIALGCSSTPQTPAPTSFLYQSGSDCSLTIEADQYTLKLFGVNHTLITISGKPISQNGMMKMDDYVKTFSINAFRAALILGEEVSLVMLSTPAYDPSTQEMTYVITPITKLPVQMVGSALGPATLFIEPEEKAHDDK